MIPKVYINPGHSDKDPGAVGYETERKLNVKVAEFMNRHMLEHYNVQTRITSGAVNSTGKVVEEANAWNADLLVSIHFNAGGGDGYEALVYGTKRKNLGEIFEKHVKHIGQNSRGVKYRPNLVVLRSSNMPAILNEGAFVDNKADIGDWKTDAQLQKLGVAYAEAAAEYLGLTPKTTDRVLYRVQVGAYSNITGAQAMQKKLATAGFSGVIVKEEAT